MLGVLAVCRGSVLLRILHVLPSNTAGTSCTRGSVLLTLPVLAVFRPTVLLILPVLAVFRPPVLQYSILGVRNVLGTPRVRMLGSMEYSGSICGML